MITFDQTVPRALVDRGDATTVLITSWERHPEPEFGSSSVVGRHGSYRDRKATRGKLTAGAVWSRLGGYYQLLDEQRHDPLLVLETIRQGALLLAHVIDDVPLATMQVLRSSHFEAEPDGLKITDAPTEVVLTIEVEHLEPDAQSIMQTSLRSQLYRDGTLIGSGGGRAIIPPNDRYLKVRGRDPETVVQPVSGLDPGVPARTVGKASDRDVVIAPRGRSGGYRLRIDARHPNFFDNPTDHTPGMLLIEAMRQAVVAESGDPGYAPLALAVRFHRFVELDHPGDVLVRRTATGFQTDVRQFDKLAARADWPSAGDAHG